MKRKITLLFAIFLVLRVSGQNFGVGLDYMMLSGSMVEDVDGNALTHELDDGMVVDVSRNSAVLNVSYMHPLSAKLDMLGSVGLGMGFELVPMKLGVSYGISSTISINLGMGIYMITDDSYDPQEVTVGEDKWKGSSNEFGIDFGVNYQINSIGIGLGYDMIKGGDDYNTLNAFTISLSHAFRSESTDEGKTMEINN